MREANAIYVLVGKDPYLEDEAIKEIRRSFFGDPSSLELNSKVFSSGETEIEELIAYLSTAPFSADKRLAAIKDFDKYQKADRLRIAEFIKKTATRNAVLVVQVDDIASAQICGLTEGARIIYFDRMSEEKTVSWLMKRAQDAGKKIDAEAAAALAELHGRNFAMLDSELEKLIAYTGSKPGIGGCDIAEVSGRTLLSSAFDLTGAVEAGKVDGAMKTANELLASGKKHYEIIGLLCWHFRKIAGAKALENEGMSDSEITRKMGINNFYAGGFLRQVRATSLTALRNKMRILLEADVEIKRAKYNARTVFEFALIRLCLAGR